MSQLNGSYRVLYKDIQGFGFRCLRLGLQCGGYLKSGITTEDLANINPKVHGTLHRRSCFKDPINTQDKDVGGSGVGIWV